MSPPFPLRAFGARNFRLYVMGQSVSLIGTWMQQLGMSWLVYRLTGSTALLGVSVFCGQIPMLFLSPFAGVLADRLDRRRVLLVTQVLLMAQAAALAALSWTGAVRVWQVLTLNVCFGVVFSLDMPTRQSLIPDLVEDKADLGNAIALCATMVNLTRLIGPALAGLVIATTGESACFALNAASFLPVIAALLLIRTTPAPRTAESRKPVLGGLRDGLAYAFGTPAIGTLLALLAVVSLTGMPYTVLMPVFATKILGGDARTMGYLTASSGVGALLGALYLTSRGRAGGLERRIPVGAGLFGVGLIFFSMSTRFWLSSLSLFAAGLGVMIMMAACNTVLQTISAEDKRGRVMSLYVTSLMGMAPVGGLICGALAARWGAPLTVLLGGAASLAGALAFGWRVPALREKMLPRLIPSAESEMLSELEP